MLQFVIRRAATGAVVLFVVSVMVFGVIHLVPGDPAEMMLGQNATPESLALVRAQLGLDQPLLVQYLSWSTSMLRGDFGTSVSINQPVASILRERFPATVMLTVGGMLVALGVGIPLGIAASLVRGSRLDFGISIIAFLGVSIPQFWLGIMLILVFSLQLGVLPPGGFANIFTDPGEGLRRLVLPSVALGLTLAAIISRMTRSSMLEVIRQDYVRTARSKGLPERRIVLRHALRNAMIPTLTVIGIQIGYLIGGAIVIEEVFYWPGLGRVVLHAVNYRDLPLLQGATMVIATAFVLINLLIDVMYTMLDPRVRFA
jgi:peptide/nickel transport system permease protein